MNLDHPDCPACKSPNVLLKDEGKSTEYYKCKGCETKFLEYEGIHEKQKLTTFPGGATRSSDADSERYDLCPPLWARSDALIMAEGAVTHGDDNWKNGIPLHVCLNHLERHLNLWKSGDRSEDHLGKVRVNAGFIMWFMEKEKNED